MGDRWITDEDFNLMSSGSSLTAKSSRGAKKYTRIQYMYVWSYCI